MHPSFVSRLVQCGFVVGLAMTASAGAKARPVTLPTGRTGPTTAPKAPAPKAPAPKAPAPTPPKTAPVQPNEPTSGPVSSTTAGATSSTQFDDSVPQPCRSHFDCPKGDADGDRIKDAWENTLAFRYAPHFRLPPSKVERLRPANVDWYLERVRLKFENKGACNRDEQVLGKGEVSQRTAAFQARRDSNLTIDGCKKNGRRRRSSQSQRFYLQPTNDRVHRGAPRNLWKTYVHVKRSEAEANGYDVQYWIFFPYEDTPGGFNHEGDWEHVTVTTDSEGKLVAVVLPGGRRPAVHRPGGSLKFNGDHPIVFVAARSHELFSSVGNFSRTIPGFFTHRTFARGPVWETERTLVMVGERDRVLNDQDFIRYGGRWGEVGVKASGSGERGPAFQKAWTDR